MARQENAILSYRLQVSYYVWPTCRHKRKAWVCKNCANKWKHNKALSNQSQFGSSISLNVLLARTGLLILSLGDAPTMCSRVSA